MIDLGERAFFEVIYFDVQLIMMYNKQAKYAKDWD